MSRQPERLQLGPSETREVLDHYDIGDITDAAHYDRGSRRSPKSIIRALSGTYLLKRRAPGQDDMNRIRFQHAVQVHLEQHGCSVAGLLRTKGSGSTTVRRGSRIYELFHFIEGTRFDSSIEQVRSAGLAMSRMHEACMAWSGPSPSGVGYHGSPDVERGFTLIRDRIESIEIYCRPLQDIFSEAHARVDELGWADLPRTIVHGDWHPGNLLFRGDDVAALLDFDSTRSAPRVSEFANGSLQFAMRFGEPANVALPESPHLPAVIAMQNGYDAGTFEVLEDHERAMIPWLMIEALIVEGIVPLAMQGRFGHVPAPIFLQHMQRTSRWIRNNADEIIDRMSRP
jgi:Ser/Thr protein kinase RdoA (MazF antagonist)